MSSHSGSAAGHLTPLQRLFELLRAERRDLWIVVVWSVGIGLLSLAGPVGVQALVNTVAFGTVLQPVIVLTVIVAVALAGSALLQAIRAVGIELIQRRVFVRLASQVTDVLLRAREDAFEGKHAPELVNRFLDVVTVQKSFSILLIDGLTVTMQTLVGMALLAVYHPYLLVFDLFLLAAIILILFGFGRGAVRTAIAESYSKYEVLAWLEQIATDRIAFRSESAAQYALGRTNDLVMGYVRARDGHFRVLFRQIVGSLLLQALAVSVLLGIGGWLVMRGELTLGQLIAAELVVSLVVSGFAKLGKSIETFYDLQAAMDKLGHLVSLPTESGGGAAIAQASGPARLRLRNVSFSYANARPVLRDISLDVAPGAKIAVHARGGEGKSTLLDLMYALRAPAAGALELDGADYRDTRVPDLRGRAALVRGIEIFPGTLLENVRMGTAASIPDVRHALADAGVLESVLQLPDGLQTHLTTGGAPLSPSQAARVMLARAFVNRPGLLLVDEVVDQVEDLRIDGALARALFSPSAPWTLIIATEDPAIWPLCDRVFKLSRGTLVEETDVPDGGLTATYSGK